MSASAEPLLALARSRNPEARERLMQGLALVCDEPEANAPRANSLISDILMILVAEAEHDIRVRLAETLAAARWAPSGLVNQLALDDIEIARPIIAKSPVLEDVDLVRILVVASVDHQIAVARRPDLALPVVKAIVERGDPMVITALAGNATAHIDAEGLRSLVTASRQVVGLRAPLARHPRLTAELAYVLYAWVGEALREEIGRRFTLDPELLKAAVAGAVGEAFADPGGEAEAAPGDFDRQEMETRLIAKLQAAGQLRPGFLLKALREGKLYLFELALAALAHLRTAEVRAAMASDRPELLALAAAAVGIDRSVFPTILSLVRALNEGRPTGREESLREINAAFSQKSPRDAIAAFQQGVEPLLPVDAGAPCRDRA